MAVAYRASATAGGGTGTNLTINKPTGTVDNDIMVVGLLNDISGTAWTLPTGWAWYQQGIEISNGGEWASMAWKRASSEGSSYIFTCSNTWRNGIISSFSGAVTSGDPLDCTVQSLGQADTSVDAASITNASPNSMNIAVLDDYNESTFTAGSSGYTKAGQIGGVALFYALQAASGASGIKAFSPAVSNGSWASVHASIKEATAGGVSIAFPSRLRSIQNLLAR